MQLRESSWGEVALVFGANALALVSLAVVAIVASVRTPPHREPLVIRSPSRAREAHVAPPKNEDPLFGPSHYALAATPPEVDRQLVSYGKDLVSETYRFIGPRVEDESMRYAGNELACKNCHLESGLKKFAAPYVGVSKRYPNFRKRENRVGTLPERVNGCMQRSMNGRPLPEDGREMRAFVAYMTWLSHLTDESGHVREKAFVKANYPNRAVDLERGERIYAKSCATCHGEEALGKRLPSGHGYQFPPLAGSDSYNTGAGMHRVLTAMAFIKGNMPLGATWDKPFLDDDDAYDVAGYINSLPRPEKANTDEDFPDRTLKPMSTPSPPYADDFSETQHKYGPYPPIYAYYEQRHGMKKTK